ncbi:hypothetical protein [Sphingomonas qomolangmaensis]|uniref:Uncharacterized protein n=1 Tax=Sphingomonas qomolangmaensis TaxID=2918765 RepID=A0ABY5LG83_9SPHN|nr:hypothetical protein [Sphingomonas qomolangmaensis]UUL83716.1 hypothetical protein NMP03_05810 [Sphingomonas qomolangmaensis]
MSDQPHETPDGEANDNKPAPIGEPDSQVPAPGTHRDEPPGGDTEGQPDYGGN